jgi:hypothetical protein
VTSQLVRVLICVKDVQEVPRRIAERLATARTSIRSIPWHDGSLGAMCYVICALQVTFQLARVLTGVRDVQKVPRRIAERLADGRDIGEQQMFFSITRQPLEWILRQVCTQCRSVSWSLPMDVSCIA